MAILTKYDPLLKKIREYDSAQALGTFTTAFPSTPSIGAYLFAGTNASVPTGGSGATYYNGDQAYWNGAAWVRIPFQSLVNYPLNDTITMNKVFYDAGFGFANSGAVYNVQLEASKAIKSLTLIGDWDNSKFYSIRRFARNYDATGVGGSLHSYWISIWEVDATGVFLGAAAYYDTLSTFTFTENTAPINTIVLTPLINGKQMLLAVDYSQFAAANRQLQITGSNNWMIKPECINRYADSVTTRITTLESTAVALEQSDVFYDGKFGKTGAPVPTALALKCVKSLVLVGDWDTSKRYAISAIYNGDVTHQDKFVIAEVPDNGAWTAAANTIYTSGVVTITKASGKPTIVVFPVVSGKQVIAIIDYSILTGTEYNLAPYSNMMIKPECIDNFGNTALALLNTLNLGYKIGTSLTFPKTDVDICFSKTATRDGNINKYNRLLPLLNGSKKGMFVFSVDDSEFNDILKSNLEKFNAVATWHVSSGVGSMTKAIELQRDGHEIGDHNINHNTDWFTIPTGYETLFATFIGNGLDSIVGNIAYLTRKFLNGVTDVSGTSNPAADLATYKIGTTNGYNLTLGSNKIDGDFTVPKGTGNYYYLYIVPQTASPIRFITVRPETFTTSAAYMVTPNYAVVNATKTELATVYAIPVGVTYCTLTDAATYVLLLANRYSFIANGLQPPSIWRQSGAACSRINNASLELALTKLGMTFGTTSDNWDAPITYNHVRTYPRSAYLYTNGLDFAAQVLSYLPTAKNLIANNIAKNQLVTSLTHISLAKTSFEGSTEAERLFNHNSFVYDLMKWLYESGIPVVTFSEAISILTSKTNPSVNIFPNLYTDLAGQSKPDGHVLGTGSTWVTDDGVPEDHLHCLKRTTASSVNPVTTVTNLGGLEKGKNNVGCWIKGTVGDTITIDWGGIKTSTFVVTTTGYNEFTDTLVIPYTTNFITIVIKATVVTSDCRISGIYLNK